VGEQKKSLEVSRGLYLIRYDSAEDASNSPQVVISPEGWAPSELQLIISPDADGPVLGSPGGCLVARVMRAGQIKVSIVPRQPQGSTAAKVQLVPLSDDLLSRRQSAPIDVSRIKVLGHLAGVGDVRVACNEWLGGPSAPSRIEGIAIEIPDLPSSVRIRYAVRKGGARPAATPMIDAGAFAGTRGRAVPLLGATFEISGAGAPQYDIAAEALFLGSPVMRVSGQQVVVTGPTGREPLVGLRIRITEAGQAVAAGGLAVRPAAENNPLLTDAAGKGNGPKSSSRIRVFRSRTLDVGQGGSLQAGEGEEGGSAQAGEGDMPAASKSKVKVFRREHLKHARE
jgi:hypothetical protein